MILKVLQRKHMQKIIQERNKVLDVLRTPYLINEDMQDAYFNEVICNRESHTRYWAGYNDKDQFAFMGGIEFIQWENSIGELSLLVFEEFRHQGYGQKAADMFLDNAFHYLGLANVYLECYNCNYNGVNFWTKVIEKYGAYKTLLPNRKYYKGEFHDSLYGSISKEDFNK